MGKTEKKTKTAKVSTVEAASTAVDEISYEKRLESCNKIALPMANKKLSKKVLKNIKKGIHCHHLPNQIFNN